MGVNTWTARGETQPDGNWGVTWMVHGDTRWGTQLDTLEDLRETHGWCMEGRTERRTAGRTEGRTVACQDGNWGDTWKVHGATRWGTRLDAEEDIGRTRSITQEWVSAGEGMGNARKGTWRHARMEIKGDTWAVHGDTRWGTRRTHWKTPEERAGLHRRVGGDSWGNA